MLLRSLKFVTLFLFLLSSSVSKSWAEDRDVTKSKNDEEFVGSGNPGHGTATFQLGYYEHDDNADGNPFLDEDLKVVETVFIVDYDVSDKMALWTKLSYDNIASASISRLNKYPQQTGASRDHYVGLDFGARYEVSETRRIGGFFGGSGERDYYSLGFGGSIEQDSEDHSSTLKLAGNAYIDVIDIIRFNGVENEGLDERYTLSSTSSWYQVINPKLHSEVGLSLSFQSGFLETAYNAVVVEDSSIRMNPNLANSARGIEITEELPSQRYRGALFGRIRQYFRTKTSVELSGRLYQDSWGISSLSFEPRIYQWIIPETLAVRLRYRFYIQSEATYYQDHFVNSPTHRTQDSSLTDFSSNGFGLKLTWNTFDTVQTNISGDYVRRTDGLDELIGSLNVRRDF